MKIRFFIIKMRFANQNNALKCILLDLCIIGKEYFPWIGLYNSYGIFHKVGSFLPHSKFISSFSYGYPVSTCMYSPTQNRSEQWSQFPLNTLITQSSHRTMFCFCKATPSLLQNCPFYPVP